MKTKIVRLLGSVLVVGAIYAYPFTICKGACPQGGNGISYPNAKLGGGVGFKM